MSTVLLAAALAPAIVHAQAQAQAPAGPAPAAAAVPPPATASAPAPTAPVATVGSVAPAPPASLDARIQAAKADVIQLNRDLLVLEEELLFPANTQLAVFVSMDVGKLFQLESVQLRLDDKPLASHLYTPLEVAALHRGGVQRLHLGHLKAGKHVLTAFFTGQGPHERDYRRATTLEFEKPAGARFIELQIRDVQAKLQPEFQVKVWQ